MDNVAHDHIFERVVLDLGKRPLQDLALPSATREFYEEIILRAQDLILSARRDVPGLPDIAFGFVVDPAVNAFATRHDGQYVIALNTGLLYLLRLLVGRMLSERTLFSWVGDPTVELADLPRIEHYAPHADQMWASEELVTPRDEVRRLYAHFITERAILFFVGHEIAHISRGHVDYWQQERQLSVYSERSDDSRDDDRLIERQCLELDADRRSVMASVNSLRETQRDREFKGLPWGEGPGDAATLFKDWSITIATLFQMMGDQQISDVDLAKSYPPLLIRWRYAQGLALQGADLFWGSEERMAAAIAITEGREEVARAFALIMGNPPPAEQPELALREHFGRLNEFWKEVLVERLRHYSYESL